MVLSPAVPKACLQGTDTSRQGAQPLTVLPAQPLLELLHSQLQSAASLKMQVEHATARVLHQCSLDAIHRVQYDW